ncbi:hypothetical protein GCM10009754_28820 [Amycolatopsis minnesotensis]|uniref:Uncharacterized protein n=1 Tax=Amycolatopsis minnesotensis TaxID=337894 RepID=A0ABN2QRB3_9PSEU
MAGTSRVQQMFLDHKICFGDTDCISISDSLVQKHLLDRTQGLRSGWGDNAADPSGNLRREGE